MLVNVAGSALEDDPESREERELRLADEKWLENRNHLPKTAYASGLFDVFAAGVGTCLYSFALLPCAGADSAMQRPQSSPVHPRVGEWEKECGWLALCPVLCWCILGGARTEANKMYRINEGDCTGCATGCFCPCCSSIQINNHAKQAKIPSTRAWAAINLPEQQSIYMGPASMVGFSKAGGGNYSNGAEGKAGSTAEGKAGQPPRSIEASREGKRVQESPLYNPARGVRGADTEEDAPTCSKCAAARRKCSGEIPCARCLKLEVADECVVEG